MIVSCVKDRALQGAIGLVAAVDEDVFLADSVGAAPVRNGYPRLLIEESDRPVFESPRIHRSLDMDLPTLVVTSGTLVRWRFERRAVRPIRRL